VIRLFKVWPSLTVRSNIKQMAVKDGEMCYFTQAMSEAYEQARDITGMIHSP